MLGCVRGIARALRGVLSSRPVALAGPSLFFCYVLMVSCFDASYSYLLAAFSCAVLVGAYALQHWGATLPLAAGVGLSLLGVVLMALGILLRMLGVTELLGAMHIVVGVTVGLSALAAIVDSGDSKAMPRGNGMASALALYFALCGPILAFAAAQRACSVLMFRVGSGPFESMFGIGERGALLLASLIVGLGFSFGGSRASCRRSDRFVGMGLSVLWGLVGISSAIAIDAAFVVLALFACLLVPTALTWAVHAGEVADIYALRSLALLSVALIVCWGGRFDSMILAGSGASTTMLMGLLTAACICGVGLHWMRARRPPLYSAVAQHGVEAHRQEACDLLFTSLSARERAVAQMLVGGATQTAIAEALGLSRGTVATYCRRIYEKAGCENRAAFLRECGLSERVCVQNGHGHEARLENEAGNENGPVHVIAPDARGRVSSIPLVACDMVAMLLAVVPGLAPYGSAAGVPPFSWMVSVSLALLGFVLVSSWQGAGPAIVTSCETKRRVQWLLGTQGAVLVALLGSIAFYRGASNAFAQEIGLVVTGAYSLASSMRLAGHIVCLARGRSLQRGLCVVGAISPLLVLLLGEVLVSAPARIASLLVFFGYLLIVVAAGCALRRLGPDVWALGTDELIGFSLSPCPAALMALGGLGLSCSMAPGEPSSIAVLSWLLSPLALATVNLLACRSMRDPRPFIQAFTAGAGWVFLGILAGTLRGMALFPVMRFAALALLVYGCALYVRELGRRFEFANLDLPGKIRESCGELGITAAESSTAALLAGGLTVDECARQRFVSRATIVSQRRSVYAKLGVRTRDELRGCIEKRIARRLDI